MIRRWRAGSRGRAQFEGNVHPHHCTRGAGVSVWLRIWAVLAALLVGIISIGKPRDIDYYLADVSIDDLTAYYASVEAGAFISGRFAEQLGYSGEIPAEVAASFLNLEIPGTGARLVGSNVKVPAFDVTLSHPKSFSIFEALTEGEVNEQLNIAATKARDAAIAYLQDEACKIRRGHAGAEVLPADGLIVLTFKHSTSRAELADPNYHEHNLIINAAVGPDGRTTALDGRHIYWQRYAAGNLADCQMRYELTTRIGVMFEDVGEHGSYEIVGIDKSHREHFSQRTIEINDHAAKHGGRSRKSKGIAALETRKAKGEPIPNAELRQRWQIRGDDIGLDINTIPTHPRTPDLHLDLDALGRRVTDDRTRFETRHVIANAAQLFHDGAPAEHVIAKTQEFLDCELTVELATGIFTTAEMIMLEQEIVAIGQLPADGICVADTGHAERAISARPSLTDEQADFVRQLTSSGTYIDLLEGKAGVGKTLAFDAAREAFEASGYKVIGGALSAKAALGLESSTGIASCR